MARESFYRQCTLERPGDLGMVQLVTWIPERYNGIDIEPGVTLQIKQHGADKFEPERWTVQAVGTERQSEARCKDRAHKWTKYRAATDV